MASYTGPLRDHAGTRRDYARLVRAISVRYTQQAASDLVGFDRPALLACARQNFFLLAPTERLARVLADGRLELIDDSVPFVAEDQPQALVRLIEAFVAARA